MTHRHDDADPVEHDPTGMRALLGSLPDPGPMPEDLVARITAALDAEARRSGGSAAGWPVPPAPPEPLPTAAGTGHSPASVVTPLHRRRWQVLGAAAAAVVVLGVGGVVVEQMAPGGLQASLGLGGGVDSAASAASAGSAAGAEADAPALRQPGVVARDDALHVLVLASGTDYLRADLAGQAGRLDAADDTTPASGSSPSVSPGEPLASAAGARACATSLGVDPSVPVVLDLARLDGTPVAVLVAAPPDGTRQAWAVQRTCGVGDPGVVAGPLALG